MVFISIVLSFHNFKKRTSTECLVKINYCFKVYHPKRRGRVRKRKGDRWREEGQKREGGEGEDGLFAME